MRRLTQTLTALVFAATALAVAGRPAAANEIDSYRDAMKSFAPVISDWLGEVDDLAAAAVVKPEVVEGPALAELARRGHGIAEDLAGTTAPGTYADAHAALIDAIEAIAASAEAAPQADGHLFAGAIADDLAAARTALRDIRSYAVRGGKGRIGIPAPPVTGN